MNDDAQVAYDLVMPFVTVTSKGGPHDDQAYAAGWDCGALDRDLAVAAVLSHTPPARTMRSESARQVDLIAMRHGYTVQVDDLGDEWSLYVFTRPEPAP